MALAIYAVAVGLRLAFLQGVQDHPLYRFLVLDERSQHEVAVAIANDALPPNGYFKAPFYAYFLGMIYKVIGPDSFLARFIQVFVVGWAPVLVYLIGGRLFGRTAGVIAGALAAVLWTSVFFSAELLDVSLACLLYLLLAYVLVALADDHPWKWFFAGGLMGLGAITRPNILAFAPVLAVLLLVQTRRGARARADGETERRWVRTGLARVGPLVLGTVLAIAPVTLRNLLAANERLLISAYGGVNLLIANNPASDGKNAICPKLDITVRSPGLDLNDPWVRWDEGWQACYLYAAQHLGPCPRYDEVERFLIRVTFDYIRRYPGKFLTDTFKRACWMLNAYEFPNNKDLNYLRGYSRLLDGLSWLHVGLIGPLGGVGLGMALRRRERTMGQVYVIAMVLALALPGVFFIINARYRLPVVHLLLPFVAYAVVELAGILRPPIRWRRALVPVGALAGLMVLSNVNVFRYRPPYHEYMLFSLAGACGAVGRTDMMDDVVADIERALADTSYRHMLHPWAMTCLFGYYRDRGDVPRAAHYGQRIFERGEPVRPQTLGQLVAVFIAADQRDRAKRAVDTLVNRAGGLAEPYSANALLAYGRAFGDRAALTIAARQFADLARSAPHEEAFRNGLDAARASLKRMLPSATSRAGKGDNPFSLKD